MLCEKCDQWMIWATQRGIYHNFIKEDPARHCHHEEEKPRVWCWCQSNGTHYVVSRATPAIATLSGWYSPTFCPDCGRKIKEG